MSGRRKLSHLVAPMLLLSTGVLALLPGGLAPKISGPCGYELCNCPRVAKTTCHGCARARKKHAPRIAITFDSSSVPGSDDPGFELDQAFSGVLIPESSVAVIEPEMQQVAFPECRFVILSFVYEIATPPPRA